MSGLRPKASAIAWRAKKAPIAASTPTPAKMPTTRSLKRTGTRRCTTRPTMTTKQPAVDRKTVADWVSRKTAPHAANHARVEGRARRVCM